MSGGKQEISNSTVNTGTLVYFFIFVDFLCFYFTACFLRRRVRAELYIFFFVGEGFIG